MGALDIVRDALGLGDGAEARALASRLPAIRLTTLAETDRFRTLDRLEQYYRAKQDDGRKYDWDGAPRARPDEFSVAPGWVVPMRMRRPDARYDLGRLIVLRLTSMLFGQDRFPELRVEGDPDAEDFVRELAKASRLRARMQEARNLGGAEGTACLSFGFVEGKPRINVHNPKHCTVLRWRDRDTRRPAAVLKAFRFVEPRYDRQKQQIVPTELWYVRYFDEELEAVWDELPQSVAQNPNWGAVVPPRIIRHGFGFCPFYWVQNIPDSGDPDGESDYEGGLCDLFDQINRLFSATTKGTIANVDPTLVVQEDPALNDGQLTKGSGAVIWARGGAKYLELNGTAVKAAVEMMEKMRAYALDAASVVLADPEKLAGAAQSGKALEILYAPMLAKCDMLREQYGEHAIIPILRDMLRASKLLLAAKPTVLTDLVTGQKTEERIALRLPPKTVTDTTTDPETGKQTSTQRTEARNPGTMEDVSLNWRPYFSATWTDIAAATTAVLEANGKKPVVSQRTSVHAIAPLYGIEDVDAELALLEEDQERAEVRATQQMLAMQSVAPKPGYEGEEPASKPDDDDDDEE